jgi:hypothetical protein
MANPILVMATLEPPTLPRRSVTKDGGSRPRDYAARQHRSATAFGWWRFEFAYANFNSGNCGLYLPDYKALADAEDPRDAMGFRHLPTPREWSK